MKLQTFRIDVWEVRKNPLENKWVRTAHQLGIHSLTDSLRVRVFFVHGTLSQREAERIAASLLADAVTERFVVTTDRDYQSQQSADHRIEVMPLPGVTDSVAENLLDACYRLGIPTVDMAATAISYLLTGDLNDDDLRFLAARVFSNPVIHHYTLDRSILPSFSDKLAAGGRVETVSLREVDDAGLMQISRERRLALNLDEMRALQMYFRSEGREPSDLEIETIAQTWSEHCVHKTFRAKIHYSGPLPGADPASEAVPQEIDGILKTYLRAATEKLNKTWVRSAFVDNAGIIRFDEALDLAFKVETHNHPSAIEPFGGANTGVGGVIRDVLGVSARPIANTDVLCFGPLDTPRDQVTVGMIHPTLIEDGVVHGIEDYGNKMGIPTVNGAVLYHPGYTANPLVFCGCLGVLPHGSHPAEPQPGDHIVVIGGRTGRDGLRGATFSSMEIDASTGAVAGSSVQIGHPINEKQVQEVILKARDLRLYHAITDCGAGGLSSAVGEMAERIGAAVQLENVPLKYTGLQPWEIWLSEAQERMVLAVSPADWPALEAICRGHDVEAVCIGVFEPSGRLTLTFNGQVAGDMAMAFVHEGRPEAELRAVWSMPGQQTVTTEFIPDVHESLLKLLAHPNIRSKENIVRRYDHEVQGATALKPLVGLGDCGPGDASVLIPQGAQQAEPLQGVAISNGICPQYGEIDPYAMAWAAIDEAMRNLVAVGTDPDTVAILDNFCWGNPQLADRLGSLVRCAQGCHDAALAYETPFISGKDSLNNEFMGSDGQRHAIPGTLLISALGIVPDLRQTVTMDLKSAGNWLYLVGATADELGASHFHFVTGLRGGTVPQPQLESPAMMRKLHQAMRQGWIRACHDVSEGGLLVSLAEMCIAGGLGAEIELHSDMFDHLVILFSETAGRFIIEVDERYAQAVEALLDAERIGFVSASPYLDVKAKGDFAEAWSITELEIAWRGASSGTAGPKPPQAMSGTKTVSVPATRTGKPRVMILHAKGTNRDHEAKLACELAGGEAEIILINQLIAAERQLLDYQMLILPGGFSYGDDLGAGVLWAQDLRQRFIDQLDAFVAARRPVLGICNGFQALVKAGLLPGADFSNEPAVTLSENESGRFECRWVYLQPHSQSSSLFTEGLTDLIYCPVAHGEGRLLSCDEAATTALWAQGLVPLTYVDVWGNPAQYPGNPNGSVAGIAALCNPAGNVMGLMPHPEDHIFPWQHPRWHRGEAGNLGLSLIENGIKYA